MTPLKTHREAYYTTVEQHPVISAHVLGEYSQFSDTLNTKMSRAKHLHFGSKRLHPGQHIVLSFSRSMQPGVQSQANTAVQLTVPLLQAHSVQTPLDVFNHLVACGTTCTSPLLSGLTQPRRSDNNKRSTGQ